MVDIAKKVPGGAPSSSTTEKTFHNIHAIRSSNKPNCDSSQVIVISYYLFNTGNNISTCTLNYVS